MADITNKELQAAREAAGLYQYQVAHLMHVSEDTMLLTGLINSQSVRTAEMLDVPCLVFVRGKIPHQDAVARAKQIGLPVLLTTCSLFEACGRLYTAGMGACKLESYNGESDDDDD